jgi:hypothetical protein
MNMRDEGGAPDYAVGDDEHKALQPVGLPVCDQEGDEHHGEQQGRCWRKGSGWGWGWG